MAETSPRAAAGASHKSSDKLIKDNLVPVITPKLPNGDVDLQGIANLVEFHHGLGTRALFTVGGLGRFHELNDAQRILAAEAFITANKKIGSPLLIFTGATSESVDSTLANIKKMTELGADVVFFAPLFFLKPNDIPDFVRKARVELGQEMPMLLYNNPDFSRDCVKNIDPDILRGCSDCYSAIKDSSCDSDLYEKFSTIDCALYTGNEPTLVEAVKKRRSRGSVGGIGNVSGTAAKLARELAADGDEEEDELKVAELTAKFNAECKTLKKVLEAHPDIAAGDMMSAIYHYCLGEAGVVQHRADLINYLTEKDKEFLKSSGFVPERMKTEDEKVLTDEVENGGAEKEGKKQ